MTRARRKRARPKPLSRQRLFRPFRGESQAAAGQDEFIAKSYQLSAISPLRPRTGLHNSEQPLCVSSRLGREILERAGLAIIESDLIGVELPEGPQGLLKICTALLQAEVNIIHAYPLLVRPGVRAAVALMAVITAIGLETLSSKGFTMITEADLQEQADEEEEE